MGSRESSSATALERVDFRRAGILFGVALVLRLIHLVAIRDSPFFTNLMLDPRMYDEWGQRIAAGALLGERPFFQDPLYAYFLGGVYAVFGHGYTIVTVIQSVLGATVPALVYLSARPWFGVPAALVSGVFAVFYQPSIYYEGMILKTAPAMFFVSVVLWMLSVPRQKERRIGTGFLFGLACLVRGNLLLFLPVLAGFVGLDERQQKGSRPGWIAAGQILLGAAIVFGASTLHNRLAGPEWILTTSNAGQNFFIGNNPVNTSGEYERLPFVDANPKHEERDFAAEAERRSRRSMTPGEVSDFWFAEARAWITAHPGDSIRLTWLKFRNFWGAYEIPDNLDYDLYRSTSPILRLPLPGFGLLAPLGLLGAVLAFRREGWPRLLLLYLVVYSASVVLFFVFSRFRIAALPVLFVFAGHAVVELAAALDALRNDRSGRNRALAAFGLFLLFFVFVNLPVRGAANGLSMRIASALGLPTRVESSAIAHFNLGLNYAARAKEAEQPEELLELAEAELRRAVQADEGEVRFHVELGKVLARRNRNQDAIASYARAAELQPNDWKNHYAQGLLFSRDSDAASAAGAFRRSLELAPNHAPSARRLGSALLAVGKREEAAAAFRRALELAPDDRLALEGLRRTSSGSE